MSFTSRFTVRSLQITCMVLLTLFTLNTVHSMEMKGPDASSLMELHKQLAELKLKVNKLETVIGEKMQGSSMNMSSDSSMKMGGTDTKMNMGQQDTASMQGMNMGNDKASDSMGGMGMMKMMGGMGMKDMKDMKDMKGDKDMKGGMGMMKMMDGMGMMKMMGGMDMMGMAGSDQQMTMVSALPGFPGASHIYHIGSTGFFLDHAAHLKLTTEQETKINTLKEQSLLKQSSHERAIEELEQELWQLTAADQPDATQIDEKIKEIAAHVATKRMDFIQAIGSAATVLSEHQRHVLAGTAKTDTDAATTDHSSH